MNKKIFISGSLAMGVSLIANTGAMAAERKIGQRPEPGIENRVTVGSVLLEQFNIVADPAPKLRDDLEVSLGIQGKIVIPSRSRFHVIRSNPLKACTIAEDTYIDLFAGPRGPACLYDDNMDGIFDRASAEKMVLTTKKIKWPVPYDMIDTPASPSSDYFKMALTYLGGTGDVLRLSYREFSHDTARPAFTEELSFPLDQTFPQTITWRDTEITLIYIGKEGLRYRIEPKR